MEGHAVLWFNTHTDGSIDVMSEHLSEAVRQNPKGLVGGECGGNEKWILSKWLRERPFTYDEELAAEDGF